MIDRQRILAALLAVLLATACGGSGSTGLIAPEGTVIDRVRNDGSCVPSGETIFCAVGSSDAITADGVRAEGGEVFGATPGIPCPIDVDGACGGTPTAVFTVSGFPPGAACSIAARPAGSSDAWTTGALVALDGTARARAFPLPPGFAGDDAEIVLLCFEESPPAVRAVLEALVDAGADVAFVPGVS